MANRRLRKARQLDRAREQKTLDDLALSLVMEGVPISDAQGKIPSQHTAIAFSVTSHLSGDDRHWEWPNQLGWLLHRHKYAEFAEEFYPESPRLGDPPCTSPD